MERIHMDKDGGNRELVADPVPSARSYQLEALEKALKQNTVVFFETGTGKTLIAIMLLRSYAHLLRKPSPYIAVFLVPSVVLVNQQGEAVAMHTDLKVGKYYGELGVDFWDAAMWEHEKDEHEVLVMTPKILLNALRHKLLELNQIKVLVFDECHNARGKHPYACIMKEFYHRELESSALQLPRVFGMTASPIKAKASSSANAYWKQISKLENLMNSKVFTCDSDSVIAQYIPISTPKVKKYNHMDIPHATYTCIADSLINLERKHGIFLNKLNISESEAPSAGKRLAKLLSTFMFCLTELGVWLAMKASDIYSREEEDIFLWARMGVSGERVVKAFSSDAVKVFSASMPSGPLWSIGQDLIADMRAGYLTPKVVCLIETLLEYREIKDLRCIIFVERIVTAIVICCLLNELLPKLSGWRTEYTAGNNSSLQSQSRKEQNAIIDKFRSGAVNIIVATSMLEEGLDVQRCKLVIRFDPSATICSFIQSRGRARMQNSHFILMVKSGDIPALARVENYLASGNMMRGECLLHADLPCERLGNEMHGEPWYEVESTGAIVTLSSSVELLYFYCSRLPSDGYFKPYPRFYINKELESCLLHLPNNCPVQTVTVCGSTKLLNRLASLEACRKLHQVGALTDNLVPDIVEEEADTQEFGYESYSDEHVKYFPTELVGSCGKECETLYHCYLIELKFAFHYDGKLQDIVLAVHTRLHSDLENMNFDLDVERGRLIVHIRYIGCVTLNSTLVSLCQRFQIKLFTLLLDHTFDLHEKLDQYSWRNDSAVLNYLLLPCIGSYPNISIDWKCINAVQYPENVLRDKHTNCCGHYRHTKNGLVCCCNLENSLVCTPHNQFLYCMTGTLDGIDGNSYFELGDGESLTYKKYYERRHGIKLKYERQSLLNGKRIPSVQNYLQRCRAPVKKEPSNRSCELPPELCLILMSPISISTFYSFSFLPSIMHRIESLLMAANLKSIYVDHCTQNVVIPNLLVLEAITTKNCQEKFHLESLETLGDSFLKYAASQHLFKTHQNWHEGLLSVKRKRMISNATLCKLGVARKITGFIRNEPFDPKTWIIPGTSCASHILGEESFSSKKLYVGRSRKLKSKIVADVAEALIGAFLSAGSEVAALSFMSWLGIDVDFVKVPYTRNSMNPERHINVRSLESLLKYSFRDASLLVEALTHGSYMLPEIPRCYQRLEFLGDAVLDYLITRHLYLKYTGLSPGLLTDLRSASVNNECYALSAIKAGLYKHVLHASHLLHRQIVHAVHHFEESPCVSTFGWESETTFPKVLGDIIESIAGAIFVDSGHNEEVVFQSLRPLLEPLVTPETVRLQPNRELTELCQRMRYAFKKPEVPSRDGMAYAAVEVEADGILHKATRSAADKKTAKKLACKDVLKSLKNSMPPDHNQSLA